jgi:hypothetical protein
MYMYVCMHVCMYVFMYTFTPHSFTPRLRLRQSWCVVKWFEAIYRILPFSYIQIWEFVNMFKYFATHVYLLYYIFLCTLLHTKIVVYRILPFGTFLKLGWKEHVLCCVYVCVWSIEYSHSAHSSNSAEKSMSCVVCMCVCVSVCVCVCVCVCVRVCRIPQTRLKQCALYECACAWEREREGGGRGRGREGGGGALPSISAKWKMCDNVIYSYNVREIVHIYICIAQSACYTHAYIHTYAHTYVHTYAHTYMHTRIRTYIRM